MQVYLEGQLRRLQVQICRVPGPDRHKSKVLPCCKQKQQRSQALLWSEEPVCHLWLVFTGLSEICLPGKGEVGGPNSADPLMLVQE